jgi:hypothetical protein
MNIFGIGSTTQLTGKWLGIPMQSDDCRLVLHLVQVNDVLECQTSVPYVIKVLMVKYNASKCHKDAKSIGEYLAKNK